MGTAVTGAAPSQPDASNSQVAIHEQVWVKVNAQVDKGIAPLIEALSELPQVRTIESCEGNGGSAWVAFDAGETEWEPLARIVLERIGPPLASSFGDRVSLMVTVSPGGLYRAEMTVSKAVIPAVSKAIKQLSRLLKVA